MRAGVRDLLPPGRRRRRDPGRPRARRSSAAATAAAGCCARPRRPRATPARVITVASPKGGVGKTTVATNLAIGLTAAAPQSTVLVDLDVQFGDVARRLSLVPEYTLPDVVRGPASEDTMVLKTFLTQHPSGLYAVCGAGVARPPADGISGEDVSRLLRARWRASSATSSSTPRPGLSEQTLAALDRATDVVHAHQHGRPRRARAAQGARRAARALHDPGRPARGA